jgi:hypothetical protein
MMTLVWAPVDEDERKTSASDEATVSGLKEATEALVYDPVGAPARSGARRQVPPAPLIEAGAERAESRGGGEARCARRASHQPCLKEGVSL